MLAAAEQELSSDASLQSVATLQDALDSVRTLRLEDFGAFLWSLPNDQYPLLSSRLPGMPPVEVQDLWTGCSGRPLLLQSLDFVRWTTAIAEQQTGRLLRDMRVLDFGCGYGRFARLFLHDVPVSHYYGVDPWDQSIALCRDFGLGDQYLLSDDLPTALPTGDLRFDLIFAFSVFTHLSDIAIDAALPLLIDALTPDGVVVITIRPPEYWDIDGRTAGTPEATELKALHAERGFAFRAHGASPTDQVTTYGDTSVTVDWLTRRFPQVQVVATHRSAADPYQVCVALTRRYEAATATERLPASDR